MKPAINVSLVPELRNTPHILPRSFDEICSEACKLGYEGVEIFPKNARDIAVSELREGSESNGLTICAFGTGAGKVLEGLTLTSPDVAIRRRAVDYVNEIIKVAGNFNAGVVIGSMQGSVTHEFSRSQTIEWFVECLNELSTVAKEYGITLLVEPINRYESNFLNTLEQGESVVKMTGRENIKLLADMFHMNIEEWSIERAIINAGPTIGHVHFADSNRLFPGFGHIDFRHIFYALDHIHYEGYLSLEAMVTNVQADMQQAIQVFNAFSRRQFMRPKKQLI